MPAIYCTLHCRGLSAPVKCMCSFGTTFSLFRRIAGDFSEETRMDMERVRPGLDMLNLISKCEARQADHFDTKFTIHS